MFFINQKIICVDDFFEPIEYIDEEGENYEETLPVKDEIYTIREFFKDPWDGKMLIRLKEIVNKPWPYVDLKSPYKNSYDYECAFRPSRFRPLVTREDDVKLFESIVNVVKDNVDV